MGYTKGDKRIIKGTIKSITNVAEKYYADCLTDKDIYRLIGWKNKIEKLLGKE